MYVRACGHVVYSIAGKFGGEFNLVLWRLTRRTAKLKSTNISVRVRVHVLGMRVL